MLVDLNNTTVAAPLAGFAYADLANESQIRTLVETGGMAYFGSWGGSSGGVALVGLQPGATQPDGLVIGVDASDGTTLLSVWSLAATTAGNQLTFNYLEGERPASMASLASVQVLANLVEGSLVGLYLPQGLPLFGEPAPVVHLPTDAAPDASFTKVVDSANSVALVFKNSGLAINEDTSNTGRRIFFDGAASANVVDPSGTGEDQVQLWTTLSSFTGGTLTASAPAQGGATLALLRLSTRSGLFSIDSATGSVMYWAGARTAGTPVASETPGYNLYENGDPITRSGTGLKIGTIAYTNTSASTQLVVTFNADATAEVVEQLMSHVTLSVSDKASGNATQNWEALTNKTPVVAFAFKPTAAATETLSMSRAITLVPEADTGVPQVELVRSLRPMDQVLNPTGISLGPNRTGPNVATGTSSAGDNGSMLSDADGEVAGAYDKGRLTVSVIQGASEWLRLGLSTVNGVFYVDWSSGNVTYYTDAKFNGQTNAPVTAGTQANAIVIGQLDPFQRGMRGTDFTIWFNQNAKASIIQMLMGSLFMSVQDPTDNSNTSNWLAAAGEKLVKVEVVDAAGNAGADTRPMTVVPDPQYRGAIMGSNAPNGMSGSEAADHMYGLGGNDTLAGGSGNDTVEGGSGDDSLSGGEGADTLAGGDGADTINLGEVGATRDQVRIGSRSTGDVVDRFYIGDATGAVNDQLGLGVTAIAADTAGAVTGMAVGQFARHSVRGGILTLMDRYGTAITASSATSMDDLTAYIQANLGTAATTVGIDYDSDADGRVDSLLVVQTSGSQGYSSVVLHGMRGATLSGAPREGAVQVVDAFGPEVVTATLSAQAMTVTFNENVTAFDASGLVLTRYLGNTKLAAAPFTTAVAGHAVTLTFGTPLADGEYIVITPSDRTRQRATDATGNTTNLLGDTQFGVVVSGAGDSTVDISTAGIGGAVSLMDTGGGNDTLKGNNFINDIDGGEGNDSLSGLGNNDTLRGGAGRDTLDGGDSNDFLDGGDGDDLLLAGRGSDTLKGGAGEDTLDGGDDYDRADYRDFFSRDWKIGREGNDVVLQRIGTDEKDVLRNVEEALFRDATKKVMVTFWVSPQAEGSNSISGTDAGERIDPQQVLAGRTLLTQRSWIDAGGGDDVVVASASGGDDITGGAGNDTIDGGGTGDLGARLAAIVDYNTWNLEDRARYAGPASRYSITQATDDAQGSVTGRAGQVYYLVKDLRTGSPDGTDVVFGIDQLQFSDRMVRLTANVYKQFDWDPVTQGPSAEFRGISLDGTAFADRVGALPGDAVLANQFKGSDRLDGGDGNDSLYGGDGADALRGAKGNDLLDGGANRIGTLAAGEWEPHGFNGVDVADYSGAAEYYTVERLADGSVRVTDTRGAAGDGIDTLRNVEVLRFSDRQVNLEVVRQDQFKWINGQQTTQFDRIRWEATGFDDTIDAAAAAGGQPVLDEVHAGAGNDAVATGAGGDWIEGGEGDDTIDAGADGNSGNYWSDIDQVSYAAPIKRFVITQEGDAIVVRDRLDPAFGGLGTDVLRNVEQLQFSDTQLALGVRYDTNAWSNNANGTAFGDVIDAGALKARVMSANPNVVALETGSDASAKFFLPAGLVAGVQPGDRFEVRIGWIDGYSGVFNPQTFWDGGAHRSGFIVTADASGRLVAEIAFNQVPLSSGSALQLAPEAGAGGMPAAPLFTRYLAVASDRDYIVAGAGDDLAWGGAGGDTFVDGVGSDVYDGGANGTSVNEWENQDSVQFAGPKGRYRIDSISYEQMLAEVTDAAARAQLVQHFGQTPPQQVLRVADRMPAVSGGDGVNYLVGIERLNFSDTSVSLDWSVNRSTGDSNSANHYHGGLLGDTIDASGHDGATAGFVTDRDWMSGGEGNDQLSGGAGSDTLVGGAGDDTLSGGANGAERWSGWDEAQFAGRITQYAISFFRPWDPVLDAGQPRYDASGRLLPASDTASQAYTSAAGPAPDGFVVVEDRLAGGQGRDVVSGVERLRFLEDGAFVDLVAEYVTPAEAWAPISADGTDYADRLEAPDASRPFSARGDGGADTLVGSGAADDLRGGTGDDLVMAGGGWDVAAYQGARDEFVIERHVDGPDRTFFTVRHLVPQALGGLGTDTLYDVEELRFEEANKTTSLMLQAQSGLGQDGRTYITGTEFADDLAGSDGQDYFTGGLGDDRFDGGKGDDIAQFADTVQSYRVQLVRDGAVVATFDPALGFLDGAGLRVDAGPADTVIVRSLLDARLGGEGTDTLAGIEDIDFSGYRLHVANPGATGIDHEPGRAVTVDEGGNAVGGFGDDTITGSAASDWIYGRGGNDRIDGAGQPSSEGWSGADTASYRGGPRSRFDIIAQGDGSFVVVDLVSIRDLAQADFADGHVKASVYGDASRLREGVGYGVDTLTGIERLHFQDGMVDLVQQRNAWSYPDGKGATITRWNISGTSWDDVVRGTDRGDILQGLGGDDTIDGGTEAPGLPGSSWETRDQVNYAGNRDRYEVSVVRVRIAGEAGRETYTEVTAQEAAADATGVVLGVRVRDLMPAQLGGNGTDLVLRVESINFASGSLSLQPEVHTWEDSYNRTTNSNITGTGFDDVVQAGPGKGSNWINGNAGNDLLAGSAGGDDLTGGAGDDTLAGGGNSADPNGWVRPDVAHYNAPSARFTITSHRDAQGVLWVRVADKLDPSDASSLGTDLLTGIESIAFSDRWVDVGVRTNSWTDAGQGLTHTGIEGSILDDLLVGTGTGRDTLRGKEGKDILLGGGGGDELNGGSGIDIIDGGANGSSGDSWRDQDAAVFSGDAARYERFDIAVSGTRSQGAITVQATGTAGAGWRVEVVDGAIASAPALPADLREALELALGQPQATLDLFDGLHATGMAVRDQVDAEFGGDGTDLVFNVEALRFRDQQADIAITAQAGDWNGDGRLDWANLRGSAGADRVGAADLASLTGRDASQFESANANIDLREGDDAYTGGAGGESVTPGAGNDYVDGGGSTGRDTWGNEVRDEVRFEGNYSRYVLLDVTLRLDGGQWKVDSARDPSLAYIAGASGAASTVATADTVVRKLDLAAMASALDRLVANNPGQEAITGWLVADRLPADMDGTGIDALTRVDAISFNDRWIPLSMQVWLNRAWEPQYQDLPYDERPVVGAGVEGTSGADRIGQGSGIAAGLDAGYDFQGDDWIRPGTGNDTVKAGAGSDWIQGDAGNDVIDGGADGTRDDWGNVRGDTVQYDAAFDSYTLAANADGTITVTDSRADGTGTDTLANIEQISFQGHWVRLGVDTWYGADPRTGQVNQVGVNGSILGDVVDAGRGSHPGVAHHIRGNEGNDSLTGGDAPDTFYGGAGDDLITGGANGRDAWGNPGVDVARYDGARSRFTIEYSADGKAWAATPAAGATWVRVSDSLSADDGGLGVDLLTGIEGLGFSDTYISLALSRNAVDTDGDGRPDNMQVVGTAGADLLEGDGTSDLLIGDKGDDTLRGGGGADILRGGAGDDLLDGGASGLDSQGRALADVADYNASLADYTIAATQGGGFTVASADDGVDTLADIEALQFTDAYIRLAGRSFTSDTNGDGLADLATIQGDDVRATGEVLGAAAGDPAGMRYQVEGGRGADRLLGGAGNDVLTGGQGDDTLAGGGGSDRARFSGNLADYAIEYAPDGAADTIRVRAAAAGNTDGTDLLEGIEELVFADQVLRPAQAEVLSRRVDTDGNFIDDTAYWQGTRHGDAIDGLAGLVNILDGGAGDDMIRGGQLGDQLTGGAGNDTLRGDARVAGQDASAPGAIDQAMYAGAIARYAVDQVQLTRITVGEVTAGQVLTVSLGSASVSTTVADGASSASVALDLARLVEARFKVTATALAGQSAGSTLKVQAAASASLEAGMRVVLADGESFLVTSASSEAGNGTTTWTLALDGAFTTAPGANAQVQVLRAGSDFGVTVEGATLTLRSTDALFAAQSESAALSVSTDRFTTVADGTGRDGTDTLYGIEQAVFSDGVLALAPTVTERLVNTAGSLRSVLRVQGTDLADILESTAAGEIFIGNGGADHIVVRSGSGADEVRGFAAGHGGDVLTAVAGTDGRGLNGQGIDTVAELMAAGTQQGANVVYALGAGHTLTLMGVQLSDLTAANFEVVRVF